MFVLRGSLDINMIRKISVSLAGGHVHMYEEDRPPDPGLQPSNFDNSSLFFCSMMLVCSSSSHVGPGPHEYWHNLTGCWLNEWLEGQTWSDFLESPVVSGGSRRL